MRPRLLEMTIFGAIILLLSAGTFSRNKIWGDQISLSADCVKKSPNKARPYVQLGEAYLNAGAYDKALEITQKGIPFDPKHGAAEYYILGLTYRKMGDANKTMEMEKKSVEAYPTFTLAYYTLGQLYFETGQYEDSEKAFQKFLSEFPYFPEVHNLLAVVYMAQKQFDKAVRELEWEIRISPSYALAHLNLGQIYWYEFQNRQKAIYHLKIALMLDPLLPKREEIRKLVQLLEGLP